LGGGGGGLGGPSGTVEVFDGDVTISGGSGGTGGGIDVGCGVTVDGLRCWLETTVGSFAKMSRKIARKSSMLDFYRTFRPNL
jgi:hypothetical protein